MKTARSCHSRVALYLYGRQAIRAAYAIAGAAKGLRVCAGQRWTARWTSSETGMVSLWETEAEKADLAARIR